MQRQLLFRIAFVSMLFTSISFLAEAQVKPQFISRFSTGVYNNASAEISAYDMQTKRMFVNSGVDTSIKVVDISNLNSPQQINVISLKPYGSDITSVASKKRWYFSSLAA